MAWGCLKIDNGRQSSQADGNPDNYGLEYDWDGRFRAAECGSNDNSYFRATYAPDGVLIRKQRAFGDSGDDYCGLTIFRYSAK